MKRIGLDFQIDEEVLQEDLGTRPQDAARAALEHTYFVMPVRFTAGQTDLLTFPGVYTSWRPQPLIGFSAGLVRAASATEDHPVSISIADGGRLNFQFSDAGIRVTSSLLPRDVEVVPQRELIDAANSFRERVRDFLLERVPLLRTHPCWMTWFPSDL